MYALYHGDTFVDLGTKKYLAELLKVSVRTITFYMTPTYQKRTGGSWLGSYTYRIGV